MEEKKGYLKSGFALISVNCAVVRALAHFVFGMKDKIF